MISTTRSSQRRWITGEELAHVFDLGALIAALEEGHREPRAVLLDGLIGPDERRYLIRSAFAGDVIGSKLITIVPGNPGLGRPAVQALIALFGGETGAPLAVMEATDLTYWKTAADSALGARLLARPNARTLLMIGAGGLAPWLIRGHLLARPSITTTLIWNRTPERAETLAQAMRAEGIAVETVEDLAAAVQRSDVVSTATMARTPILQGAWLSPGTHVDLVGGYAADTREADDETLRRGRLFVDCRESALHGVGDIVQPLAAGVLTEQDVLGDLYDLVQGRVVGRETAEDITVFKNAGGAHLDLMVAAALLERLLRGQER